MRTLKILQTMTFVLVRWIIETPKITQRKASTVGETMWNKNNTEGGGGGRNTMF